MPGTSGRWIGVAPVQLDMMFFLVSPSADGPLSVPTFGFRCVMDRSVKKIGWSREEVPEHPQRRSFLKEYSRGQSKKAAR